MMSECTCLLSSALPRRNEQASTQKIWKDGLRSCSPSFLHLLADSWESRSVGYGVYRWKESAIMQIREATADDHPSIMLLEAEIQAQHAQGAPMIFPPTGVIPYEDYLAL